MGRADGTDPALVDTPVPLEGDGHELLGMLIDGRYRLDATLGRGGMGLVCRAAHVRLRRQAAVKILHPALAASPEVRNRFEREALAVGKIDHPNCVNVYDVGRLPDGLLYLAMELLEGKPLADVLEQEGHIVLEQEGHIAPGRALHILAGILRGLAHLQEAKLIHRDIKPENIFLIRHGEDEDFAKVLDFGIAKPMEASDLDDGVRLTQAGMAFGTPICMAPEQALGNPIDGRADLYAAAGDGLRDVVRTAAVLFGGQTRGDVDDETDGKLRAALRTMAGGRQNYAVGRTKRGGAGIQLVVGRTSDPEAKTLLLLRAVHDDMGRRKATWGAARRHGAPQGDAADDRAAEARRRRGLATGVQPRSPAGHVL